MSGNDSFEQTGTELKQFVRELFMQRGYYSWVDQLSARETDRWYSLIVTLDHAGADLTDIKQFGEAVYRDLVFDVTRSPTFKTEGDYMIRFTVAGRLWYTMVWHTPAPGHDI